jgi:hypothetical protein
MALGGQLIPAKLREMSMHTQATVNVFSILYGKTRGRENPGTENPGTGKPGGKPGDGREDTSAGPN